jgi:hypothetical protein
MEVTFYYIEQKNSSTMPPSFGQPQRTASETKELKQAVDKVEQAIAAWTPDEKRQAVASGFNKQIEIPKEAFRAIAEEIIDNNTPGQRPPGFFVEAVEIATGERRPSDSAIVRIGAMGGACCCLDIIWIPLGLFFAYKLGSGTC